MCQSFRNPALLAKMGATLQLLSGGRFTLGIGAGWYESEYLAYGYEFPRSGIRVEQLEEAVQIIKKMWVQEQTTFEGKYHRVKDAYCEPRPDPVPVVMIGAFEPKMLRLTAQHADWWNVSSTSIADYRKYVDNLERACDEVDAIQRPSAAPGAEAAPVRLLTENSRRSCRNGSTPVEDFKLVRHRK